MKLLVQLFFPLFQLFNGNKLAKRREKDTRRGTRIRDGKMERVVRSREKHAIEKHFQFRELGCTNSKANAFQYDDLNFPLRIANEPIKGRGRRNKWRGYRVGRLERVGNSILW